MNFDRNSLMKRGVVLLLAAAISWPTWSLSADDPPPAADETAEVAEVEGDGAEPFADGLIDEGFRSLVEPEVLQEALKSLDPQRLADVTLLMASAERTLGRTNATTSASSLLDVTLRANPSSGEMDRLEKSLALLGRSELVEKVQATRALGSGARSAPPENLGLDQLSPEDREIFDLYLAGVEEAKILGNKAALEGMSEGVDSFVGLTDQQRDYLRKQTTEAIETAPSEPDAAAAMLTALSSQSRSTSASARVLNWCSKKMGQQVMRGECAELPGCAFINVGAKKIQGGKPAADDYIWGTLIRTVTPGKNTTGAVEPGCVLQYRNAKYKNGNYTGSASHHTSVVKSVAQDGSYLTILQQNSNGVRKVTEGVISLKGLTAGTIWIYRPIDGRNIFPFSFKNASKKTISYRVNTTNYTLSPGKTRSHKITNADGKETYGVTWPNVTTGGITIGGGETGYLEGQRMYTFSATYSLQKTGWITSFYY